MKFIFSVWSSGKWNLTSSEIICASVGTVYTLLNGWLPLLAWEGVHMHVLAKCLSVCVFTFASFLKSTQGYMLTFLINEKNSSTRRNNMWSNTEFINKQFITYLFILPLCAPYPCVQLWCKNQWRTKWKTWTLSKGLKILTKLFNTEQFFFSFDTLTTAFNTDTTFF